MRNPVVPRAPADPAGGESGPQAGRGAGTRRREEGEGEGRKLQVPHRRANLRPVNVRKFKEIHSQCKMLTPTAFECVRAKER